MSPNHHSSPRWHRLGKGIGGIVLATVSLFMLMGFFTASSDGMSPGARGPTFVFLVILPALGGGALIKLTIAEVVAQSGLDADSIEQRLLSLMTQGFGDYELTGTGAIVYSFYDMDSGGDKEANVDHQEI